MLAANAQPESALWLAIRAVAFADMRDDGQGDTQSSLQAGRYYGAALARMRSLVDDEQEMTHDRTLAAMLLLDNYEVTCVSIIHWHRLIARCRS